MSVRLEQQGSLATLTLACPERGNPVDEAMVLAFAVAVGEVREDQGVRALLIRSEGRHFSVGGDVEDFAARLDDLPAHLFALVAKFHAAIEDLASLEIPVITAVQGSAAGAGLSIVCLGDIVVAGRSSRFVVAYPGIGLTPDAGATWTLPRLMGPRAALDLLLTNRRLTAQEALAAGLVSRVVDDDVVGAEAERLAMDLAAGPTAAYAASKRLLRASASNDLGVQLELERASLATLAGSADGREGIRAYLEKRVPDFQGR
jgi:2-(1,2-epoxy-1,2-dihydrophenyl)acetyl-CoA isomerase